MKLLTPRQMRELDNLAINEVGIPGAVLMENAGLAAVSVLRRLYERLPDQKPTAVVLAGGGNNGGDGSVVARHLHNRGWTVELLLCADPASLEGDAALNWRLALRSGVPACVASEDTGDGSLLMIPVEPGPGTAGSLRSILEKADVIVDGLLGTGGKSAPRGVVARAISTVLETRVPVLALDVPSGVDAETGAVPGVSIRACDTVTFGALKTGLVQFPAAFCCGHIWVADISIPRALFARTGIAAWLLDSKQARDDLPVREPWMHKGDFGHVALFAGSGRYPGAGYLCASGALRAGAGLVTLLAPHCLFEVYATKLSEAMVFPVAGSADATYSRESVDVAGELLQEAAAVAVGPGITTGEEPAAFLRALLESFDAPLVLDADALTIMSRDKGVREAFSDFVSRRAAVMTPHPGEASRLLGASVLAVQQDRLLAARSLAREFGCVVTLKGARTVIAEPGGKAWVNPTGNEGLGTGGTGDVLTGCVASLLAQGSTPAGAARAAAYMHGLAADFAAQQKGASGMTAGDVAERLPEAQRAVRQMDAAAEPQFVTRL
jgi:NAD(P)H-hydrate epimerase